MAIRLPSGFLKTFPEPPRVTGLLAQRPLTQEGKDHRVGTAIGV